MDPISAVGAPNQYFSDSNAPSRSSTNGSSNFDIRTENLLLRHTGSGFAEWTVPDYVESPTREALPGDHDGRTSRSDHPECSFSLISVGDDPISCDIIFVHGLSGDDKSTWSSGSTFWPLELSRVFPNARLLSFKYDRSIWAGSNLRAMQSVTEQLLAMLTTYRRREVTEHRPIIFVVHSLGGCIVKAAVALAKGYGSLKLWPTYSDINECTKGIVFFATPHRTRTALGWHSIVNRVRAASHYAGEIEEPKSPPGGDRPKPTFMTLLSAFESSLDDGHIAIYSCFETHETGTDRLATLVTSGDNALGHRYENVAYLDGNHITICQFQTINDPGFKIVKDLVYTITDQSIGRALNAFRNSFPTFGQQSVGFPTSELERFIVSRQDRDRQLDTASDMGSGILVPSHVTRLFLPTVMLRRVKRILTQPVFGLEYVESLLSHGQTADWVTKNERYREWRLDKCLLLVTGPLGAGKTSVAHDIATHLAAEFGPRAQQAADKDDIVLHHFFNHQSDPGNHFLELLHQFILQLLEVNPSLVRHFSTSQILSPPKIRNAWPFSHKPAEFDESRGGKENENFPPPKRNLSGIEVHDQHDIVPVFTSEDLVETLFSMLRGNPVTQIFIVVDGLDECDKSCQPLVKQLLRRLLAVQNTKVCITCQSESSFLAELGFDTDEVALINSTEQDDHKRSINAFARRQLKDVERHLLERRFRLPDDYFERIQKLFATDTHESFLWIKLVRRVVNGVRNLPALQGFINAIMPVQAAEPTLDINGLHHWILEFLIGNRDKLAVLALFFVGLANRPLKPEELAALLATTKCMKQDGPTPNHKTSRAPGLSLVGRNRPPIARTASPSLAQRASLVSSTQTFQEERAREEFWMWIESQDISRVTINTMEEEYRSDLESWLDGELFHLLTFQGGVVSLDHPSFKHSIVTFLTEIHPGRMQVLQREMASSCLTLLCLPRRSKVTFEFDPKTKTHDPPILQYAYAMKNWHKHLKEAGLMGRDIFDLVKELWDDEQFHSPLLQLSGKFHPVDPPPDLCCLLATLDAHLVLGQQLLEERHMSEVEMTKSKVTIAIACATANASYQSLMVLVKDTFSLGNASELFNMVPKLLKLAEETGSGSFFEQTSVFLKSVMESLAQRSGRPSEFPAPKGSILEASKGRKFLKQAVLAKNTEAVEKILQRYKDREDLSGELKLEGIRLAISQSDEDMVSCFLKHGADINAQGPGGDSLLHLAASAGDLGVVRLLVSNEARKSAIDNDGRRPIHLAARRGHYQVVEYLLSNSPDKDAKLGRTPLFYACSAASLLTIQVLLAYGKGSINLQDKNGYTPLHIAASIGAKEAVQLLLVEGADPGIKDRAGLTPLHLAAFGGWEPVISCLLAAGAEVSDTTRDGQTALHFAAQSKNPSLDVVQTLISAGVDANVLDVAKRSALYLSIKEGSPEMVRVLLGVTAFAGMPEVERSALLKRAEKCKKAKPRNHALVEAHLRELELAEEKIGEWNNGDRGSREVRVQT